ncbi:MAG TPA: polysaccharide ABC transporter ATP-binding protein [Methylomirabilota bacterium]|nr:polysaccharide ABC transporter ATP-binding protein [Methylomirabilota bacterium]
MASDPAPLALCATGLGKRYTLDHWKPRGTLREALDAAGRRMLSWAARTASGERPPRRPPGVVWALRGVSFEVASGEIVGLIGRNGAGKSTLLRILSRITEPTEGHAVIHGRIGSLLEVGTGFHPELTGRENVYLNGAILGMRRREIDRKFDQIVDFAGVSRHVDTPVKYYSSGMYVRLAFAVAAHLEPDILLVDEVLAVGDLEFQRRCLGKMDEVARGGRTILFVSHHMNQVRRLCQRCIWLDQGEVRLAGTTVEVVAAYERAAMQASTPLDGDRAYSGTGRFVRWELVKPRADEPNFLLESGALTVRVLMQVNRPVRHGHFGITLYNADSQIMWANAASQLVLEPGLRTFELELPGLPLRPGVYYWHVSLHDEHGLVDYWQCVPELIIGTEPVTHPDDRYQGVLNVPWDLHVS